MYRSILNTWTVLALLLVAPNLQLLAQQDEQQQEPGQKQQQEQQQGPYIYPNLAASLIDRGVPVVDVRSDQEVEETGVLADAEHIPHTDIDALEQWIGEDRNRAVILYCGSGRRASMAIQQLRERGYHGLVNAGGFEDLEEALEGEASESE